MPRQHSKRGLGDIETRESWCGAVARARHRALRVRVRRHLCCRGRADATPKRRLCGRHFGSRREEEELRRVAQQIVWLETVLLEDPVLEGSCGSDWFNPHRVEGWTANDIEADHGCRAVVD